MEDIIKSTDTYILISTLSPRFIAITRDKRRNGKQKRLYSDTDKNLIELPAMKVVLDSLHKSNIKYTVFDDVRVEPTDQRYLGYILISSILFLILTITVGIWHSDNN